MEVYFRMLLHLSVLSFVIFLSCNAQDPVIQELGSARILGSKFFLSQYAVEDTDYVIDYRLYNIGDKPALKVTLDDRHSFPTQTFDIVRGLFHVAWERLAPGANVTHSVIVRPRQFGLFNYTAAQITYYPSEEAKDVRLGYTTTPGESIALMLLHTLHTLHCGYYHLSPLPGYIYRLKDYERRFSSHLVDWAIFALMAFPCLALPLALWYNTKSKYETEYKKSK